MSRPRFDQLDLLPPSHPLRDRLWREWCFLRVLWRHFAIRAGIMVVLVLTSASLFVVYGGEEVPSFSHALFYSWSLAFGEPPTEYPESRVLDVLFFAMPIVGLTVIIEGIIDFALTIRDRRRFERSWCQMMASSMHNHIVLIGFGQLGFSTYLLLRKLGESVVVIERNGENQFLEELRRDGTPLIIGDARREALLADANIAGAKSVIVATNDDLANLEISLDARRIKPGIRVVLRMFDQNMADKVSDGFNIRLAMSQSAMSAPAFAMSAVDRSIVHSFVVENELVVMQHWKARADGPLAGRTVLNIMRSHGVNIVKRRPKGEERLLFPDPEQVIEADDHLLVQGPYEVLKELDEYSVPIGAA